MERHGNVIFIFYMPFIYNPMETGLKGRHLSWQRLPPHSPSAGKSGVFAVYCVQNNEHFVGVDLAIWWESSCFSGITCAYVGSVTGKKKGWEK